MVTWGTPMLENPQMFKRKIYVEMRGNEWNAWTKLAWFGCPKMGVHYNGIPYIPIEYHKVDSHGNFKHQNLGHQTNPSGGRGGLIRKQLRVQGMIWSSFLCASSTCQMHFCWRFSRGALRPGLSENVCQTKQILGLRRYIFDILSRVRCT